MLENIRKAEQEAAPPTSLLAMGRLKAEMAERQRQAQLQARQQQQGANPGPAAPL